MAKAKEKPSRVQFLSAYSGRRGLLGTLAFPEEYPAETEFTMFLTTIDDEWWQLQFPFDLVSLTYLVQAGSDRNAWWLVGKRGEVVEVVGGNARVSTISTAGTGEDSKLGYLSKIRNIDGDLFICGYRRQVYRRENDSWPLISGPILDKKKKGPWNGFESIDGFSTSDVYAVGDEGEIWHYDGAKWEQCDSPTNRNLADVRCFADGKVWACGDGGTIICGNRQGWDVVWADDEPSENWWGMEQYEGQLYIAGNDFLGKLEKNQIKEVKVRGKSDLTTQTLHERGGLLWSVGEDDILVYDGKTWREVICPQNR